MFCVNVGAALTGSGDTLVELRCTDLGAAGDVSGLIVSAAEALRERTSVLCLCRCARVRESVRQSTGSRLSAVQFELTDY